MDSALNLAMSAQGELLEAVERLRETEEELGETKKKVLFLQKQKATRRTTSNPLAEAFSKTTYDHYHKLISKRAAVEETLTNATSRYRSDSAKFRYMAAEMSSTLRRDRKIRGATDCDMEVKGDASLVK